MQNLWLFVNSVIENPTFDSQTKETLTSQPKTFGSKYELSESFLKNITDSPIIDKLINWNEYLEERHLKKLTQKMSNKSIKGIKSLDDANKAGTKNSIDCVLILTEGDSAKTLAVAGE